MSKKQQAEIDLEWAKHAVNRGTIQRKTLEAMREAYAAGDHAGVLDITRNLNRNSEDKQPQ